MYVCVYALYAFRNRRWNPDQTPRGAPSRPRARLRLPESRKFWAPRVPPYCGGEGIFKINILIHTLVSSYVMYVQNDEIQMMQ